MMTTKMAGRTVGHDTTMCGDPKTWFPMRVTYSREMKVKGELDRLGIENFIPMTYRFVDVEGEDPHRKLVPAINNLIFVHSTQEHISGLKATNELLEPLRYMIDRTADHAGGIKDGRQRAVPRREYHSRQGGQACTDYGRCFQRRGGRNTTSETVQEGGGSPGRHRLCSHHLRPCATVG